MNALVLDCSIAAAWLLGDEDSPEADAVLDRVVASGAVAPALWWAEVRNVLVMSERRGRLTVAGTATALAEISALDVRLDYSPESALVLRLAREHRLTVYDSLYLELAVRERRPLATLDRKLRLAAEAEGVQRG